MKFRPRKSKKPIESQRSARVVASKRPSFVYYSSRRDARVVTERPSATDRARNLLNAPVGSGDDTNTSKRRKIIVAVAIIVGVVLVSQGILLGGGSRVMLLQPDGTQSSEDTDTYRAALHNILGASIVNRTKITINPSKVARELQRQYPEIESVIVTVPLLGLQPTAYVVRSEGAFTLQQGTSFYTLSESGHITESITGELSLPLVQDETGENVTIGKRLLPRSHVAFMQTVLYQFEQADLRFTAFVLPADKAYEVAVRLDGKPYIVRFNFEEDAMQQSGAAIATIKKLGTTEPASYIDVRVPGRVYYK